jgi:hypothetical protein
MYKRQCNGVDITSRFNAHNSHHWIQMGTDDLGRAGCVACSSSMGESILYIAMKFRVFQ